MPVLIRELLKPGCIALSLEGKTDEEAILGVVALLEGKRGVLNYEELSRDILTREHLSPTCIGNSMAIPHARTDHVESIVMAVGRCEKPIDFDGEAVRLVFAIGIPRSLPGKYLALIGALGRLAHNETILEDLMNAASPKQFLLALPSRI